MKSEFLTNISYEMRTPLSSILGFSLTLLHHKDIDDATRQEFIQIIYDESVRLIRLVDNLFWIYQVENNVMNFDKKAILLEPILHDVISIHQNKAKQKELLINCHFMKQVSQVWADAVAMKQVVDNLLANAVKYAHQGGRIDLSLKQQNGFVIFEIQDDGIGIPKQEQEHIFDKYYRIHHPDAEMPGVGIGLTVVSDIVNAHQGMLEVESEENKGSIFRMRLPVYDMEYQEKKQ